jgi:hypothetical protein
LHFPDGLQFGRVDDVVEAVEAVRGAALDLVDHHVRPADAVAQHDLALLDRSPALS